MPTQWIEPFDLKTLFVNYFLGSQELFPYAIIIIFSYACAYFGMPNNLYLIILTLASLMYGSYLGEGLYVLTLFIVGFFIYKVFSNFLK